MAKDYVDRVLEQWSGERPDLDTTALAVVSRVSRLALQLKGRDVRVLAEHGVGLWAFEVLAALRRQGPPFSLSPTALQQAATLTSGAMTNRIDRLEALGWVARRPDLRDRRGVVVRLTPKGRKLVDRVFEERMAAATEALAPLEASERRALARLLKKLLLPLPGQAPEGGGSQRRPSR